MPSIVQGMFVYREVYFGTCTFPGDFQHRGMYVPVIPWRLHASLLVRLPRMKHIQDGRFSGYQNHPDLVLCGAHCSGPDREEEPTVRLLCLNFSGRNMTIVCPPLAFPCICPCHWFSLLSKFCLMLTNTVFKTLFLSEVFRAPERRGRPPESQGVRFHVP